MGLLDSPAIQKMFAEMIKSAAPDLAEHIDNFGNMVKAFKDQLDRIEARQIRIENLLTGENDGQQSSDKSGAERSAGIGRIAGESIRATSDTTGGQ